MATPCQGLLHRDREADTTSLVQRTLSKVTEQALGQDTEPWI